MGRRTWGRPSTCRLRDVVFGASVIRAFPCARSGDTVPSDGTPPVSPRHRAQPLPLSSSCHTHTRPFLQSRAGDSHTVAPGPSPAGLAHGCQDLSAHPARARGPLWVNGGCPPDVGGAPGWRRTERPRQGQNHSCLLQHKPEPSKGPSARTPRAPRAAPRTRQAYRQELRVPLQSTRLRAKENP